MDGLSRAAGADVVAEAGGRTYRFAPLTLNDLGVIENHILRLRGQLEETIGRIDGLAAYPAVRDRLRKRFIAESGQDESARIVSHADCDEWIDRPDGVMFSLWLSLLKRQPRITLERVEKIVKELGEEQAKRIRNQASGCDMAASLDWQEKPKRHSKAAPQPDKPNNWRRIFRALSRDYGWSPEQIGRLTLYQVKMYCCEDSELSGPRAMRGLEKLLGGQ